LIKPPSVDIASFRSALRDADIEEMVESLLATFLTDSAGRVSALEHAVAAQDPKSIESAAHAFKSGAGTIRATRLAELLRDVEDAARAGRSGSTKGMIDQVRLEYAAVCFQLDALLHNAV
jgi:HPt (histidine-containing phosphotransfer) domain-containing protein